jgi:ATP/maltotriose-dependent transcriptional regulator MalT
MEYSRARLGQVTGLLDRLIAAADKHKAAVGPELLVEFQALKTTFDTAREGQVESKGELAQARSEVATTRTVLELQLGRNLLIIATHHLGRPERAADYFAQSLLEDPTRNDEDETPPPAPAA